MKRHRRKTKEVINTMNVVPYIDVMLVLLVIFMVTAPMFVPGVINLPSVGKSSQISHSPIQITIDGNNQFLVNKDNNITKETSLDSLVNQVKNIDNDGSPVVISADKNIIYDKVISVVNALYMAGIKKVALVVKQQTNK